MVQSPTKDQLIAKLQAVIRGFIIRKNVKILKAVVRIQRWWRKIKYKCDNLCVEENKNVLFPLDLNYYAENVSKASEFRKNNIKF